MDSKRIMARPEIRSAIQGTRLELNPTEYSQLEEYAATAIEGADVYVEVGGANNPQMQDAMESQLCTGIVFGIKAAIVLGRHKTEGVAV